MMVILQWKRQTTNDVYRANLAKALAHVTNGNESDRRSCRLCSVRCQMIVNAEKRFLIRARSAMIRSHRELFFSLPKQAFLSFKYICRISILLDVDQDLLQTVKENVLFDDNFFYICSLALSISLLMWLSLIKLYLGMLSIMQDLYPFSNAGSLEI